jgi:hypothetical protein
MSRIFNKAVFFRKPGQYQEMLCKVCGSKCQVFRNDYGPTSWASAMAKRYRLHDEFCCPYLDSAWHDEACQLHELLEPALGRHLNRKIRSEINAIVANNIGMNSGGV